MTGAPVQVLVAPDSFKGTFSATEVAAALGAGLTAGGCRVSLCPVADGGEGTLDVLLGPLQLELVEVDVCDPLGRPITARFGLGNGVAVVEIAAASGLGLIAESERDALAASSYGTGQLLAAAIAAGAQTVYVAVGGSATTDGGQGAIEALGSVESAKLVVLCDVRTPFEQAAEVFGPQKGADPETVELLTRRLLSLAENFERDPRGMAMMGAAGGLAGGLWATCYAEVRPGAAFVLEALDFPHRMHTACAIVVGEGRMDRQTLSGKIAGEIATRARHSGVPCYAVVGQNAMDQADQRRLGLQAVLEAGTLDALEAAGWALAARL